MKRGRYKKFSGAANPAKVLPHNDDGEGPSGFADPEKFLSYATDDKKSRSEYCVTVE